MEEVFVISVNKDAMVSDFEIKAMYCPDGRSYLPVSIKGPEAIDIYEKLKNNFVLRRSNIG